MKGLLLTEENALDIYKKLCAKQEIPQEELNRVLARFNELVNAQI